MYQNNLRYKINLSKLWVVKPLSPHWTPGLSESRRPCFRGSASLLAAAPEARTPMPAKPAGIQCKGPPGEGPGMWTASAGQIPQKEL